MEKIYNNLHKMYSLSKTLRFELKPIGKTKENIEKSEILKKDEHRAYLYAKVKKYCDEYHKIFIEESLRNITLQHLEEYDALFKIENKTDSHKKQFKQVKAKLREEIVKAFKANPQYKGLDKKDMITDYLKIIYQNDLEKMKEIEEFYRFTTYFKGYYQNRQNMYVSEEKTTAIAYRLIDENLPTFINNKKLYQVFIQDKEEIKQQLMEQLQEYIQVDDLDTIFSLSYFNNTLTEMGIEQYNLIISGKTLENGKKLQGLNEYINEYNQHNGTKYAKLTQLYKQILSDKIGTSFVIECIQDDLELIQIIDQYYNSVIQCLNDSSDKRPSLVELVSNIHHYDLSKIYVNNDLSLTNLSQAIFGDWKTINTAIAKQYDKNYTGKKKVGTEKYEQEKRANLKRKELFSIQEIKDSFKWETPEYQEKFMQYIQNYFNNERIEQIHQNKLQYEKVIQERRQQAKSLLKSEMAIEKIKELLDSLKTIQEFMKLFIPKDKSIPKEETFYQSFMLLYEEISEIVPIYNKVRNYLTQKPYSIKKIKLNFENSTLLDGWDVNKEKNNLGVIFKRNDNYYLGIINPWYRKALEKLPESCSENGYQKMEYKLLPSPNKMLPRVFFSKSRIGEFQPSKELLEKYEKGLYKKGEHFDITFCRELIDFFKQSLNKHEEWRNFHFQFRNTEEYNNIGEFYKEVEEQGYKLSFKKIDEKDIEELVNRGDLYLFQIYNKDFSSYAHANGHKNLHTMYWEALFDSSNLSNIVYKLDGQAEIFYRKASLELQDTAIHKANQPIPNKNDYNVKKQSTFSYDLIKNKRYTVDKFQFHVPITINFINERRNNINEMVNKNIKNAQEVNVIGIDRGERNLLYYTILNSKGEIIEQESLNVVKNKYNDTTYETNYHDLLDEKEKAREQERQSWKTVENIKELKEGYLSQVIHQLTQLMRKYHAVCVMEDLNSGFKNSRIKVEKQVYQKFEKMLITKLNYLVFKDVPKSEEGGLLNAYQLTNQFNGFNEIGKQSGILFYVPAWCTSKIDPTTGFVNLMTIKYENVEKAKDFISKWDDIKYNEKENFFEFQTDYTKFTNKSYGIRKDWTICTYADRIEMFRNKEKNNEWDCRKVVLTNELKLLLEQYGISLNNCKSGILLQNDKAFFERLFRILRLTLQMRNSVTDSLARKITSNSSYNGITIEDRDYIISPVKNNKGYFYDSRKGNETLPKDADANGAYHIAQKGRMLIEQIKNTPDANLNKVKFTITNQKWLEYIQKRDL